MNQWNKVWGTLLLCLVSLNVHAHNVVAGAYVEGMSIEGEMGFSNGEAALPGVVVEVFDEAGNKVGETLTEEGGLFVFVAKKAQKHVIKANLGAGHVATIEIEADEFSVGDAGNTAAAPAAKPTANADVANTASAPATGQLAAGVTVQELESIVRKAVAKQVRPLQKELRSYKDKVMIRDIAGGLGFIFGLCGVAAWMASRKTVKSESA